MLAAPPRSSDHLDSQKELVTPPRAPDSRALRLLRWDGFRKSCAGLPARDCVRPHQNVGSSRPLSMVPASREPREPAKRSQPDEHRSRYRPRRRMLSSTHARCFHASRSPGSKASAIAFPLAESSRSAERSRARPWQSVRSLSGGRARAAIVPQGMMRRCKTLRCRPDPPADRGSAAGPPASGTRLRLHCGHASMDEARRRRKGLRRIERGRRPAVWLRAVLTVDRSDKPARIKGDRR